MADPHPLVNELLQKTKHGEDQHKGRVSRYDTAYEVYRPQPAKNVEPWQSKLRVPYGMQVIDTALVNIVSGRPRVRIRPRGPEHEQAAKAMQRILDYYISEDHFVEKQPVFVQQGLIYGVTVAKNHWLYQECEKPVRKRIPNPMEPEKPLWTVNRERVVERDGPTFEPWDVYDAWWDPDARDVDSAAYVVLRSWVSKDDLDRLAYNEDAKTGVYHNLEELYKSGNTTAQTTAQNRFLGGQDSKRKEKIELLEIWRETPKGLRITVLGNRQVILRDDPTPYWHGKKPIVITQTRPDLFEMQGIPETELVDHLQQALWTVQNLRGDNLHLTVMRGITYREGGVTDPNALELRPRFKWPVTDHDDIKPFEVQPLPPEAYNEEEALLSRLQLVTGINPYISGADLQSVDQNTATGVTALQEVASRLLRFKAGQIHNKGYQRTYEQWSEMVQQLMEQDISVKIEGVGNEYSWETYGPGDIIGSYEIELEGSEESLSRQQERGEAIALLNAFAPFAQAGINLGPILERVASAYDFPNPQALLQPAGAQPVAAPNGGSPIAPPAGGQMPPQVDPRITQGIYGGR